jgi:cytochrome c oxidase subunit 2
MTVGTVAIWIGVLVLALYAARTRRSPSEEAATRLIVGAGVAFPLAVLTLLLVFGLAELPAIQAPSRDTRLGIEISGSQWWWRVRYMQPGREPIELANELRLPAGRRVNVTVASRDVVHSFWVPALAGKMDMIPGRVNRLALEPTRVGTYRGTCAEFCGMSHARMSFAVVVTGEEEFGDWLSRQAEPAGDPQDPLARQGLATFMARGCQTCHTIRGTPAAGRVGPDLTHVGSRATIAAGTLAMSLENLARWIAEADVIKPGAHMPAFINLPQDERAALAAYLAQLQ